MSLVFTPQLCVCGWWLWCQGQKEDEGQIRRANFHGHLFLMTFGFGRNVLLKISCRKDVDSAVKFTRFLIYLLC